MNTCLNCGAEIIQKNGGKERKFCDNLNKCKQAYFNRNKKPPKFVLLKTFQELKERFDEIAAENMELKSAKVIKDDKNKSHPELSYQKQAKEPQQPIKTTVGDKDVVEPEKAVETPKNKKPVMMEGESGVDFLIRLNEWKKIMANERR